VVAILRERLPEAAGREWQVLRPSLAVVADGLPNPALNRPATGGEDAPCHAPPKSPQCREF
jgi:hypothetical protein